MVQVGDRVRLGGLTARVYTGEVVGEKRWLGQKRWVIELDTPWLGRPRLSAVTKSVNPIGPPTQFAPGQRVVFTNRLLEGCTGTVLRRSRLLWKRAWLVELDDPSRGIARTRATRRVISPVEDSPSGA